MQFYRERSSSRLSTQLGQTVKHVRVITQSLVRGRKRTNDMIESVHLSAYVNKPPLYHDTDTCTDPMLLFSDKGSESFYHHTHDLEFRLGLWIVSSRRLTQTRIGKNVKSLRHMTIQHEREFPSYKSYVTSMIDIC